MSDGKGGDDLRVFDDLTAGKGWSLAPDAPQPNTAAASSDELEVVPDPFGSPFPKGMPPLPRSMPPLPVSAAAIPAGMPPLPPSMPPLPPSARPLEATSAEDDNATEPGDPMVQAMTEDEPDNPTNLETTNEPLEAETEDSDRAEEAITASGQENEDEDEEQVVDSDELEPPIEAVAATQAPHATEERLDATSEEDVATEEENRDEQESDEEGRHEQERNEEERSEKASEPAEEPLAAATESSDARDSTAPASEVGDDVKAMPPEMPQFPAETSAVAVEALTPPIARETVRGDWTRASVTPPPPWARTTSSTRPMPIVPVARTSIVPPPPPRSSARAAGTPIPPPVASSLPPLPKPLTFSDAVSATKDEPVHASPAAADEGNPFLAPMKAPEEGGPASLLPPPPTHAAPVPPPPQKRSAKPPPALSTTTRSARPLPPPPPRAMTSSMEPPPALSGTVPPYQRRSLDSEISALQAQARRRKMMTFGAVAALGIAAFYVRKSTTAGVDASQPVEMASLHATAKHDGIKLVLDGKELGALPQDVKDLAPGEHSIVFEGSDRYESEKNTISLAPNEKKELELVSLKVSRGSATFDVKPPGTTVELVSGDERRAITDFSHPVDIDTSKTWSLEASKPGFKPISIPVTFDDQAEKTFVVALTEPIRSAPPPVETPASPAPTEATTEVALAKTDKTDKSAHATLAKSEPAKAEPTASKAAPQAAAPQAQALAAPAKAQGPTVPASAPPAAKAPNGNCTLNINSLPTSKVTLDGHPIGFTPKLGVSVPAGTHSIMLVSDSGRKATSATCKAGETKTVAIRMMLQ